MTFRKSYTFQSQLKNRTLFYYLLKSLEILTYIAVLFKIIYDVLGLKFLLWANINFRFQKAPFRYVFSIAINLFL